MFSFDRLYELSKLHGVSKSHLCSLAGKNGSYISDLRRMQRTPPFDIINTWAKALHTTPAYLLGETDKKEKPTTSEGSGQDDPLAGQLFAAYGEVKEYFDQDDIDDVAMFIRMKAERKRAKEQQK